LSSNNKEIRSLAEFAATIYMEVKSLKELASAAVAVKLILSHIVTPYSYRLAPEMRNYVKNELKHGNLAKKIPAEIKPFVVAGVPQKAVYVCISVTNCLLMACAG